MKAGFTLIEVLIATAIASILGASLFFSFYQTEKVVTYMTDYVDIFSAAILVDHQLSKDVAGAFIPVQAILPKKKPKQKQQQGQTQEPPQKEEQQQKKPILKDTFMSQNRGSNMSMFSFITNNPMRIFWGKKTGEPKPSIARVVYTLEEDKDAPKDKPRFILYRQEGADLNLAPYTKKESNFERYQIADNIKACTLEFVVSVEPEEDKQKGKEGSIEFKTFKDWQLGKDEKDLRSKAKIPDEVRMTLTLWDSRQLQDREFVFTIPIVAGFQELPEPEPLQQEKKAVPKKAGQPAAGQAKPKDLLVTSANKVVDDIRSLFGS